MSKRWNSEEADIVRAVSLRTHHPSKEDAAAIKSLHKRLITVRDQTFQPRGPLSEENAAQREDHRENLIKALRTEGRLEPIVVWKLGEEYCVIDGHHRLEAYKAAGAKFAEVPVRVFVGSFDEAWGMSIRLNRKDRLPLSKVDKENTAWRMVIKSGLSVRAIADYTGFSKSTVARMKQHWDRLKATRPKETWDSLLAVDYWFIRKNMLPSTPRSDLSAYRLDSLKNRVSRFLGADIRRQPERVAQAVTLLYPEAATRMASAIQSKLAPASVETADF